MTRTDATFRVDVAGSFILRFPQQRIGMPRHTSTRLFAASLCAAVSACSVDRPTALRDGITAPTAQLSTAGFVTSHPAQAEAVLPQASVTPIISSGDILPGSGEAWAPIPDGMGAYFENGSLNVFVNHELSSSGVKSINVGPTIAWARVSKLTIDPATMSITNGWYPEDGSTQLQRLCSATWADGVTGLPTGDCLTVEESLGTTNGSVVTAIDKHGAKIALPHLGSFAHENRIVVPCFPGKVVSIGMDDTAGAAELYMYVAADETAFIRGTGKLYVFRTSRKTPHGTNLHSGNMADGQVVTGDFVEIADPADLGTAPTARAANLQLKVDALGAMRFVLG